jgi:hypothetical protein
MGAEVKNLMILKRVILIMAYANTRPIIIFTHLIVIIHTNNLFSRGPYVYLMQRI